MRTVTVTTEQQQMRAGFAKRYKPDTDYCVVCAGRSVRGCVGGNHPDIAQFTKFADDDTVAYVADIVTRADAESNGAEVES